MNGNYEANNLSTLDISKEHTLTTNFSGLSPSSVIVIVTWVFFRLGFISIRGLIKIFETLIMFLDIGNYDSHFVQ